ncbi:8-oxo-dGTP diphosphatase [Prosthecobacter sp.]|uniref:8-oxo-dGTP diphosphatase n=1 Tax=Prosthecobacter sp. TaxID=1965333 RepID=UPI003783F73C
MEETLKRTVTVDWKSWQPGVRATLMFIIDEAKREVLLIRKKRGLGAGKINGPGGKIDPGETSVECAVRETQEELGVTALNPAHHGELWFQFVDGLRMHVDVYVATRHEGEAVETPEAVPLWTSLEALPFEEMWADDIHWLAQTLIERRRFMGRFVFDDDRMLSHEVGWL